MDKVIYKYDVDVSDSQTIDMPKGAQLLSVGVEAASGESIHRPMRGQNQLRLN